MPVSHIDMEVAYSLVVFPASQTPYSRQPGQKRLMQSDRHADGHRDTWMCGRVAGETEGQVGVDRGGSGRLKEREGVAL